MALESSDLDGKQTNKALALNPAGGPLTKPSCQYIIALLAALLWAWSHVNVHQCLRGASSVLPLSMVTWLAMPLFYRSHVELVKHRLTLILSGPPGLFQIVKFTLKPHGFSKLCTNHHMSWRFPLFLSPPPPTGSRKYNPEIQIKLLLPSSIKQVALNSRRLITVKPPT